MYPIKRFNFRHDFCEYKTKKKYWENKHFFKLIVGVRMVYHMSQLTMNPPLNILGRVAPLIRHWNFRNCQAKIKIACNFE